MPKLKKLLALGIIVGVVALLSAHFHPRVTADLVHPTLWLGPREVSGFSINGLQPGYRASETKDRIKSLAVVQVTFRDESIETLRIERNGTIINVGVDLSTDLIIQVDARRGCSLEWDSRLVGQQGGNPSKLLSMGNLSRESASLLTHTDYRSSTMLTIQTIENKIDLFSLKTLPLSAPARSREPR